MCVCVRVCVYVRVCVCVCVPVFVRVCVLLADMRKYLHINEMHFPCRLASFGVLQRVLQRVL